MEPRSEHHQDRRAFAVSDLEHPIVQAPMAGGPSTIELAAAVAEAGALPFLAAGYKPVEAVRDDVAQLRARTGRPFGVNLFAPPGRPGDRERVAAYAGRLRAEADRYGVALGAPRHDDDGWSAKLDLVVAERVPVVSVTFGCPAAEAIARLQAGGAAVWVTVTTPAEAVAAADAGADALVVQGVEAGGHRGSFDPEAPGDLGLLALLQLVGDAVELPMIAAGGIADGRGVAAVLAAGAAAAQLGTALMLAREAGTSAPQREALEDGARSASQGAARTALTRAFTGRTARGIVNRFLREHGDAAPSAYPEIHHLTAPVRAAARAAGDAEAINLWAGQAYPLARPGEAGEIVRRIAADARTALADAARRHGR
jgi:nitronate monooxygenase